METHNIFRHFDSSLYSIEREIILSFSVHQLFERGKKFCVESNTYSEVEKKLNF
jgi:hypothetical protein